MNEEELDEKAKAKKKDAKGILYLGEDEGYWSDLVAGLKAFKQINFDFKLMNEDDPAKIQNFLKVIQEERPRVVFVDLDQNTEAMIHVLRAQIRTNSPYPPFIVALTGYTQGNEAIRQAIMAGAKCVHVKSGEVESVVYDTICFAFNNALEHHGFAMAKLNDDIPAYVPAKASIVSAEGLRVESNFNVTLGNEYFLNTHWSKEGILASNKVIASSQTQEDLFYNFEYAQEFGFEFLPPFEVTDETDPDELENLEKEHEKKLNEIEASMNRWINEHSSDSRPKKMKTLVIDKELTLYQDQELTDSYDFVVRVQPYVVKAKKELMQLKPQMIVYNFEEINPEELEASQDVAYMFNEANNLKHIIKTIKSIPNYSPFIVCFNTQLSTEQLQKKIEYTQIIGYQVELNNELMVKMGNLLMQRMAQKSEEPQDNEVILDKKLNSTYAEFKTAITLIACSENDVYFNSDEELEVGTVLRLNHPANLFITVADSLAKPKADAKYYAIVHGVGEQEKKELRRFVNSVFFRAKEAAKEKEAEETEKLKQKFIQKAEEEKAQKELALAQEKEEAKKGQDNVSTEEQKPLEDDPDKTPA
ncbi:MAG: hypothetical protein KC478_02965 [Bacteriovoracaceae bacterium]|nr:hypothetical protein [Bacteriovoracaceae bacterium]